MSRDLLVVMEAVGASGITTVIAAWFTARFSGSKQSGAEPNGERKRLQDEVYWLRAQMNSGHPWEKK